jgi:hypothetical protein
VSGERSYVDALQFSIHEEWLEDKLSGAARKALVKSSRTRLKFCDA